MNHYIVKIKTIEYRHAWANSIEEAKKKFPRDEVIDIILHDEDCDDDIETQTLIMMGR